MKGKDKQKIIVEFYGRAGIVALAKQIARHIPSARSAKGWPVRLPFRKRLGKSKYVNPMIVDTSALVDGRIADVASSGFIYGTLVVIPAVISELHTLADNDDDRRRFRGRRGLDVLASLKRKKKVKVVRLNSDPAGATVDEKLITLARSIRGQILTVDFNLNKVAGIHNIGVLNINELANAVRTAVLPHDRLMLLITDRGKGREQGVGYLADGTMVVVEGGAGAVGRHVDVAVLKVLQTAAGKMIFARRANANENE